ncbi:MarR family transcriptional regulator [Lysinibacillus sphaericus CBAM5]|uniref:Transcriptional regulator, MarR family n=3 Tax=Lysinibacillus TaxID=400634 RepID=B1HWU1_LYSSC|nr:transcriptional regulator, MarR family [Lysinibacillus sphaericus C3-41]EWH33984.1 MarR family transcriptional regulator [Lysinibacillus sphaericus CBAM5]
MIVGGAFMKIKQFAEKFGLSTDTVRYYEKEGLLHPQKLNNGYRVYDGTCEQTMKFILVLRQLGFSLQEINFLLTLEQKPISTECNEATVQLFSAKIAHIEQLMYFYQHALRSLQLTKALMADGQFQNNQEKINLLMEDMYQNLQEGRGQYETT